MTSSDSWERLVNLINWVIDAYGNERPFEAIGELMLAKDPVLTIDECETQVGSPSQDITPVMSRHEDYLIEELITRQYNKGSLQDCVDLHSRTFVIENDGEEMNKFFKVFFDSLQPSLGRRRTHAMCYSEEGGCGGKDSAFFKKINKNERPRKQKRPDSLNTPGAPSQNASNDESDIEIPAKQSKEADKPVFLTASGKAWGNEQHSHKISFGDTQKITPKRPLGLCRSNKNGPNSFKPSNTVKRDEPANPDLPEIKGVEPRLVELILNEILEKIPNVDWSDVAGLEFAKTTITEVIIWPMLRPDIFTGLRGPPRGVLLFGPPGTGKTLIGKCIAAQSKATFFSISASSLTSKYIGEGEKMVRSLFAVARHFQPSVVFIDEIDSLLTQRSDSEHESSRRLKTEFLVQLDGCGSSEDDRVVVIGATNRPQELDDAARRRLVKRLYIPLPDHGARRQIIERLLATQKCSLTPLDVTFVVEKTEDVTNLCKEAAIGPLRSSALDIYNIKLDQVPPITLKDFEEALKHVKSSVSPSDLGSFQEWNEIYGTMHYSSS